MVFYSQIDPRWKDLDYSTKGEDTTIGRSGCGPTCAAMILSEIMGMQITPVDTCKWSLDHGYKAKNQGTYYSYFPKQFAEWGINCNQLSWVNGYGKLTDIDNMSILDANKYYHIACLGPGEYTKSGHFIVVEGSENGRLSIYNPSKLRYDKTLVSAIPFCKQVKYWFRLERINMTNELKTRINDEISKKVHDIERDIDRLLPERYLSVESVPSWAKEVVQKAIDQKFIIGDGEHECNLTKDNLFTLVIMQRTGLIK